MGDDAGQMPENWYTINSPMSFCSGELIKVPCVHKHHNDYISDNSLLHFCPGASSHTCCESAYVDYFKTNASKESSNLLLSISLLLICRRIWALSTGELPTGRACPETGPPPERLDLLVVWQNARHS